MGFAGIPFLENKYPVTMDLWPMEAREFNRIYEFYDNLKAGRFTTTKCKKCGHVAYPPRVLCPECYSEELEYIDLPKKGKVIVFTEQLRGVPLGFEAPLIHAWIDLGVNSPVKRMLSRIINCPAGRLKEGDEVQFVVFDVPAHPIEIKKETIMAERVFFAFEPVAKQAND
ncbi:MAG: zinc ribbon domain-containing protein [Chloroflexi bacterium]|nr:zinc ribbon domain-containing protein [Chloroflexota bacterium]